MKATGKGVPSELRMENQTLQSNSPHEPLTNRFDLYRHLGVKPPPKPKELSFPNFDLLTPEETDKWKELIHDHFCLYYANLGSKTILLVNKEQKMVYTHKASDNSRYSSKGKQKKQKETRRRLGAFKATFGWLVTPTFAAFKGTQECFEHVSQLEAWKNLGKWQSEFMDRFNKLRARRGFKKRLKFFRVPETQPGTGYPHNHIMIPGLKIIGGFKEIQALWPYGSVDFTYFDNKAPADYLTKYISKMDGEEFTNEMLYTFHLRMFSMSQSWGFPPLRKKASKWIFHAQGFPVGLEHHVSEFTKIGYTEHGQLSTEPRGP